jgi:hypothetical protein
MFCPKCGAPIAEGKAFCGKCGSKLHSVDNQLPVQATSALPLAPLTQSPIPAAAKPKRPMTLRRILTYAFVVLLAVLGGVAWWWFHRPAPTYKVQDPGIYPFQGLSADGTTVKWGFIDADGKVIVQPQWDAADSTTVFGQNVYCNEGFCGVQKDGKWGFVDTSGKLAIPNQFDAIGPFVEGLARVKLGNQVGYIDKTGQYVINPQFDGAEEFHNGLAAVHTESGWGFINKTGAFAIKPQFQSASSNGFSEGLAAVCTKGNQSFLGIAPGKCGYIDRSGRFTVKPQFDSIGDFSESLASVRIDNKWGYIDRSGKIVINLQFDAVTMFSGGLAAVTVSGNTGTINKRGKFVVNPGQYNMQPSNDDVQRVFSSDGAGLMTRDGKWVVKPSKAILGISMILKKVFYATIGEDSNVPISISGKVLAGPYKGEMLDVLTQNIQSENSAQQSVHTLIAAEASYSSTYPAKGFTASIVALGPAQGTPNENHAGLIDAALATGTKDGYQFTITIPSGTSTGGTNFNYFLVGKPASGHAGRSFCADSTGTVHSAAQGEECTVNSPLAESQVLANSGDSVAALFLNGIPWHAYGDFGDQRRSIDPQSNHFEKTAEGLRLYGNRYRGGAGLIPAVPIMLDGRKIYIKWKADGAGDYMGIDPDLIFFDSAYPLEGNIPSVRLSRSAFTTNHSWEGSQVIRDNTWYFTTAAARSNDLFCVTAEGNYAEQGGRVIDRMNVPKPSNIAKAHLWLGFGDFYKGEAANITVADARFE